MVFKGTFDPLSYTFSSTSVREDYFYGAEQRINEKIKNKDLNELYLLMEEFVFKFNIDETIKEKKDFTKLKYGIEILWTLN